MALSCTSTSQGLYLNNIVCCRIDAIYPLNMGMETHILMEIFHLI